MERRLAYPSDLLNGLNGGVCAASDSQVGGIAPLFSNP